MAARARERENYMAAESFQRKADFASQHAEIMRRILLGGRENSLVKDKADAA
jgi:hypothetical protein